MSLSPQWLDELRSRITLSGVISRTTRLTKAGREFKACCPFHNEKTPSFTVNDEKGFYHCFGCGAHGDAIRWMTDQRGLSFMDAVKELAVEAGMEVPAPDPQAAQRAEKRDTLFDVMEVAQNWFVDNLRSADGAQARAYLEKRGFDARTIDRFGFGFAPDSRQALKQALTHFPEEMLIEAGLRITVDGKEPYDRFRGRLMLPIQDARGRVIAFGGRIMEAREGVAKYLNSPDTPLFDKGRTLYNIHRAAPAARQSGRLIVVEGYMDVIALAAVGIDECVAPMGTALTEQQIDLLWRHSSAPVLCFDGDAAGQRAAIRAATRALPLIRPSRSLQFVDLPSGVDPDDIIRRAGIAGMQALFDEAYPLYQYLWKYERNVAALETPEHKAGLLSRLEAHVESISDPNVSRLYRKALRDEFFRFAYPKTDPVSAQKELAAATHPSSLSWRKIANLPLAEYQTYMRKRLGAAIAQGLILWPDQVARFAEELATIDNLDPRIEAILDETANGCDYNDASFLVAIAERGITPPEPEEFSYIRFPFAWPMFEREYAISVLAAAIDLYVTVPKLKEAFDVAQARYENSMANSSQQDLESWESEATRLRNIRDQKIEQARSFEMTFLPTPSTDDVAQEVVPA